MSHDLAQLMHAAHFAAQKHAAQRRKGDASEPYVNHVLEVAHLVSLTLNEPDPAILMAALLHDTIEDCDVTQEELAGLFGEEVATLVAELTDDRSLPKSERKRLQVEHAAHRSPRAQTIKLADKISNLRSILNSPPTEWDSARKHEYLDFSVRLYNQLTDPHPKLAAEFAALRQAFEKV
jgi:GTP diphosphokinase / guanosine-3',5'-bis(diphosphate) 3'-diphosphatase